MRAPSGPGARTLGGRSLPGPQAAAHGLLPRLSKIAIGPSLMQDFVFRAVGPNESPSVDWKVNITSQPEERGGHEKIGKLSGGLRNPPWASQSTRLVWAARPGLRKQTP